jgi:histidine triad (HIT) family protein
MSDQKTIFAKIIDREIPADIVYESENVLAFRDIAPQAPVHILIIPKKPLRSLLEAQEEDRQILGECLIAANLIIKKLGLADSDYRIVSNVGETAGQTVFHLHFHLLAGRDFSWPPG